MKKAIENNTKAIEKKENSEKNAPNKDGSNKKLKLKERKKKRAQEQLEKQKSESLRGIAKSGRIWKTPKEKFRKVKKSMPKYSAEKQQKLRDEIKHIKELSKSIKEERKHENELKKQRRLENAQRRQENERKSEIVQVIKNPAKIKRMKRKQLRQIEKRDTSKVKVV